MLNDVEMMVFAILTSLGSIAGLLTIMARLEPAKPGVPAARQTLPSRRDDDRELTAAPRY